MDDTFGVQWRSYVKSWVNKQEPWTMHDSYDALWTLNNEHLGSGVKVMLSLFLSTERWEPITIARCWQIIFEKKQFQQTMGSLLLWRKTIDMHVTWSFPTKTPVFLKRPVVMVLIGVASMDRNIQTTSRINCAVSLRSFLETHGYTRAKKRWRWWPGKWVKRWQPYHIWMQDKTQTWIMSQYFG